LQNQIDQVAQSAGTGTADTEIAQARVGADGTSYETLKQRLDGEDAKAKDSVSELLAEEELTTAEKYPHYLGHLTDDGKWNNINSNFQHIVIPISGAKVIKTSFENVIPVGFLQSYEVVSEGTVDYSDAEGYTGKITTGLTERVFDVPADANYLVVENINFGTTYSIYKIEIDGYDIAVKIKDNLVKAIPYRGKVLEGNRTSFQACQDDGYYSFAEADIANISDAPTKLNRGGILEVNRHAAANVIMQRIVTVNGKEYIRFGSNAFQASLDPEGFYKHRGSVTSYTSATSFMYFTLEGTYQVPTAATSDFSDCPSDLGGILEVLNNFAAVSRLQRYTDTSGNVFQRYVNDTTSSASAWIQTGKRLTIGNKTRWIALGDSITQGYYSFEQGDGDESTSSIAVTTNCWARFAADYNGYVLTNSGVGGSGYVRPGTVLDEKNAREHVENIDFSQYDFCTLAYGINDWKGGRGTFGYPLGTMADTPQTGGTVYSNMKYVIEKILDSNPAIKIVVITPINSSAYGTSASNWALGTVNQYDKTLEDYVNAEKEVAAYYGIEVVDMTHFSVFNRISAPELMADGVHPTLDGHKIMGKELAGKLTFK
jgi:lysophospholipase L1-like esterase